MNIATLPRRWTPVSIGGCILWLNAQRKSSLFTTDTGSTNVANSGDTVGRWEDLSGAGNNATQPVAGRRPTWAATEINSLPAVNGDGVDDGLILPVMSSLTGASTIFIVTKQTTTTASLYSLMTLKNGSGTYWEILHGGLAGYPSVITMANQPGVPATPTSIGFDLTQNTTARLFTTSYNGGTYNSTASYADRLDRSAQTMVRKGAISRLTTDQPSLLSRVKSDGTANGVVAAASIAEILVFTGSKTAANISAVEAYMRAEWGTA